MKDNGLNQTQLLLQGFDILYNVIFEKGQFPGIIGYNKTVKRLIAKIFPQRYTIISTNIYALIAIADILNPFTPH